MYKDDIKELYAQKREAKRMIILDFLEIYLKLRILFPELEEERNNLISLVQLYINADNNETDVLKAILFQYGDLDEHDGVDTLLEDFDEMYNKLFDYCQNAFLDYDTFFEMYGSFIDMLMIRIRGMEDDILKYNRHRMKLRRLNFSIFDKEYKEKILVMLPSLPNEGDDVDGEINI